MRAKFDISVNVERSLVRMTMSGSFSSEDIAQFVIARDEVHHMLQCRPNQHLTLVDIREMDIQAQDCVVAFWPIQARYQSGLPSLLHDRWPVCRLSEPLIVAMRATSQRLMEQSIGFCTSSFCGIAKYHA